MVRGGPGRYTGQLALIDGRKGELSEENTSSANWYTQIINKAYLIFAQCVIQFCSLPISIFVNARLDESPLLKEVIRFILQ